MSMILNFSPRAEKSSVPPSEHSDIHILSQFFINSNELRQLEITKCLRNNVDNPHITHIHLLNERIYTTEELGVDSPKIIQYDNLGKRVTFKHIIDYIHDTKILGYFVFTNIDIIFDETLANLRVSTIHESECTRLQGSEWKGTRVEGRVPKREMFALLRYEYNAEDITKSKIFGPHFDSQDTWIFHSNNFIDASQTSVFDIEFGRPGCDNKIVYLMNILGFTLINDPDFIKTYHFHTSSERNHIKSDIVPGRYGAIITKNFSDNPGSYVHTMKILRDSDSPNGFSKIGFNDNLRLGEYIASKIEKNDNFIIMKMAEIENSVAYFARMRKHDGIPLTELSSYVKCLPSYLKRLRGIKISSTESLIKFSQATMSAFSKCEMLGLYESWGYEYVEFSESHKYFIDTYAKTRKNIWMRAFDVYNYIHDSPWTLALRGKRVLIISSFAESIREKIPIRKEIYGIDLLPECEVTAILPPQTQLGNPSQEFDIELNIFFKSLDDIRDTYDYALVSAGGYSAIICDYIFRGGKSSIYVGASLQMMFGIKGGRWDKYSSDIIKLYENDSWSRPKISEHPAGIRTFSDTVYI